MARLDPDELRARYADWRDRIAQMHEHAAPLSNPDVSFKRLSTPPSAWRVGLFTTAGAHVDGQEPFDVTDPHGDPTIRIIPDDVDMAQIRFAHSHYDTSRAEHDPNVVLPIEPLRAMVADGEVGASSPRHVAMMGWNPDPARVIDETGPQVVDAFIGTGVDVVIMSPG